MIVYSILFENISNTLALLNYLVNEHGDVFFYHALIKTSRQAASNRVHEQLAIVF